jgi:signal transduction histidine kinase
MKDRLAVLGGTLTVEATRPRGTRVRGIVPLTGSRTDV